MVRRPGQGEQEMNSKKIKVFLTSAHNKASGGGKVLNQVCNLFREKGYEGYLTVPGEPVKATWMEEPAPVITLRDMVRMCNKEDIIIDAWQKTEIWEATMSCPAKIKVFWSHGASIPIGRGYVGAKVFAPDSGYTHQWNTSTACQKYIEETYNLEGIEIVNPLFDDDLMKQFLAQKDEYERKGILCLGRRGSSYIPYIISKFCPENKITVIHGSFRLSELYNALLRHRFFISVDAGVAAHGIRRRIILDLKSFLERKTPRNSWLVPKGHILGFPMTAAEAAWLGTVVIGFPMGGGLEWMKPNNCFMAKDRDLGSLLNAIEKAINCNEDKLKQMAEAAFNAIKRFNKENTWKQMAGSLKISEK